VKILVIGLSNLGDALLTYPALHALWKAYPEGEFHMLASPRTWELFAGDPRVKKLWVWDKKAGSLSHLRLIPHLCRERFGLVVDFRNSLIPLFMPWARRTPILRGSLPNDLHRAQAHLDLVTALGVRPVPGPFPIPFGAEEERQVEIWLEPGRRPVVVVPGARSHLKRWGTEKFAALADRLVERFQVQILLVGEEAEGPIAEQVRRTMKQPVTDLVGRTSIRELAALLAKVPLMITNDSACLHAAELMGVPSVAIFGPTDERKYGPRNPRSVVMRKTLSCSPCERATCFRAHECMGWLDMDDVYLAAAKILDGK